MELRNELNYHHWNLAWAALSKPSRYDYDPPEWEQREMLGLAKRYFDVRARIERLEGN